MSEIDPNRVDADQDGMPDVWNAKMPALAFILAMIGLFPTLFALRGGIGVLGGDPAERTSAFIYGFLSVGVATGAIIAAAYGARAATKSLAYAGRWIGVVEAAIAVLLMILMFFKK